MMKINDIIFANIWRRFLACLIDVLFIGIDVIILISIFRIAFKEYPNIPLFNFLINYAGFIFMLLFLLYSVLMPRYFNGFTLGGSLTKSKITSFTGNTPKLWQLIVRSLILTIFIGFCGILDFNLIVILLFILGSIQILFKTDKFYNQTAWDHISKTYVIKALKINSPIQ